MCVPDRKTLRYKLSKDKQMVRLVIKIVLLMPFGQRPYLKEYLEILGKYTLYLPASTLYAKLS